MMALPPDRYAEVEALLGEMEMYLTTLALEIDARAPNREVHGPSYRAALHTAAQLAHLRSLLQQAQEQQRDHQAERRRRTRRRSRV